MGEPIFDAGDAVNEQALNLSVSLPQTMPQVSTFFSWSFVGTFIQKSPDSFISLCEYLDGLTDILRSGGFEQTTPHHAMVSIFAFLLSGCASGGELSIHVIPDNTEDYFLQRYYFLTEGGTRICLESDVVAGGSSGIG